MISREQIIQTARSYLGIPWTHQGRTRRGVDCIGLVIAVGWDLGLLPLEDYPQNYSRQPDGWSLRDTISQHLVPKRSFSEVESGDILLFTMEEFPSHVGIYVQQGTRKGVIHSYLSAKSVVCEHLLDASWISKVSGTYRFPLLGYV